MIETSFQIPFVGSLALREKQIQQNYRPIIAVHKWFARRPGTLFRSLILSEFLDSPLDVAYYESHQLDHLHILDPFMGGGTPLIEANRLGCSVTGCDVNPMSWWIVKEELGDLDLDAYEEGSEILRHTLRKDIGELYETICVLCGSSQAQVKYFLWVKTVTCPNCSNSLDLFPGYLIAQDRRHPYNVFLCAECGQLSESESRKDPGKCSHCGQGIRTDGPASRGICACSNCGEPVVYPIREGGAPKHRMFAIEYYCPKCRSAHRGRFFKAVDAADLDRYENARRRLERIRAQYIPTDPIPTGDETDRLLRWGYKHYREMFNSRQLLGLELSARLIAKVAQDRIRDALSTNLSDLLRYQNMLCRYDPMALKSLDIFSVHGFPVGLIACESNLLGIVEGDRSSNIGSGGWSNIIEKYRKAKAFCRTPFEVRKNGRGKALEYTSGEWIGETNERLGPDAKRLISLHCGDSAAMTVSPETIDAVFTDPPYFGNVQYAELMDFCYVWLRQLVKDLPAQFRELSTRSVRELTGNLTMGRDLEHFTEGLSHVFQATARGLKRGRPLVFTYHHNRLEAYLAIAVAILDSGLTCSASLPCPAEMGASIHINGTGSSIVDSVFVCRSTGRVPRRWISDTPEGIAAIVENDVRELARVYSPSSGDIRCLLYGHIVRLATWFIRESWPHNASTIERINRVRSWIDSIGDLTAIERRIHSHNGTDTDWGPLFHATEVAAAYSEGEELVSF